ncbi:hypothetical protein, partial [Thalassotalea piscium]|uniref:hypothetical protein n=1 Tax=Thalassotalea piscium TaxID=1230533 RepID=UPI001C87710D
AEAQPTKKYDKYTTNPQTLQNIPTPCRSAFRPSITAGGLIGNCSYINLLPPSMATKPNLHKGDTFS